MTKLPEPGRCLFCGCSEFDPCAIRLATGEVVGCWWLDAGQTVCSMPMCHALGIVQEILLESPDQVPYALDGVRRLMLRNGVADIEVVP